MYMFIVGLEFRSDHFMRRGRTAAQVSIAGMLTPFLLGALLAVWLHNAGGFFPEDVQLYVAIMFMGASMCITAFPMLARIIIENKLSGTALGTLALAAGAIDDVAAWSLLAVVLSVKSGEWSTAVFAIGGGIGYALVVLGLFRPLLRLLTPVAEKNGKVTSGQISFVLVLVMFGAYFTDAIGVYAVFGAFLMGVAMPRGIVSDGLVALFEPLTVGLLLPLFFTYSGLNTRLDMVNSPWLLMVAAVVLIAASLGKGGACWAAARIGGEKQGTAIAIGALMNAAG